MVFDNSLRDQHNFSHHTKADVNNCFIVHSKYFGVLNKKSTSSKTFFKTLAYFSALCQDINRCFLLANNILRAIYALRILVFLPFSFSVKFSYFVFG